MLRRHKQNLSHYHLTTFDMGQLVPVGCVEVLPGDTFQHTLTSLLRVTPLVRPVMHPVHVHVNMFFVPNRIVWDEWEDFITQNDPDAVFPTLTLTGSNEGLVDRLGVPTVAGLEINALPIRGYNLIYNEFFRDEQLNSAVDLDQMTLLRASWQKDYFTTCRPEPQQGEGAIVSFSAGTAPITGAFVSNAAPGLGDMRPINEDGTTVGAATGSQRQSALFVRRTGGSATDDLQTPFQVDLTAASGGFSINDWRNAMALQRFAEWRNRFGSRYTDLLASYGVNAGDARLGRPERIGGGRTVISFSEVLSTADTSNDSGQVVGDMAGHGIAAIRTRPYKYFFPEHGYMLALMTVRPKTVYMDAIHRTWVRTQFEDFWAPQFEVEGNQAVTETEIYAPGGNTTNVFGYQSKFNDYRYQPSFVSGDFRNSTSYDWHMARDFSSAPTLNGSFVQCDPTDRIYADTNQPEIFSMIDHRLVARRLVSKHARNP